jgi:hypothetical protein
MNNENNCIEINRQSCNNRTEIHLEDKIATVYSIIAKKKNNS